MEPTDKAATEQSGNTKEKDKIGFEGWLFYILLFLFIAVIPIASYIVMLSIA